jgi:ketosteroid isomerase-like protein
MAAMTEEDVEVVRKAWEAWLGGDIDAVFAQYDPEVVWDLTHFRDWPDPTYHGAKGVRQFLTEWLEIWDDYEVGLEELIPASGGRVVALGWQRGTGRHSGLAMEMVWGQISTVRNGKITRIDNYDDRAEALEAAGLEQ